MTMTTREIYFKEVFKSDGCPIGMVGYLKKDSKGIIQLGCSVTLELRTDEKISSKSIEQMKHIENEIGFMFWNSSKEGEKFFKKNWPCISKQISNMIINQK